MPRAGVAAWATWICGEGMDIACGGGGGVANGCATPTRGWGRGEDGGWDLDVVGSLFVGSDVMMPVHAEGATRLFLFCFF